MTHLLRFPGAARHNPRVEAWFFDLANPLRLMVRPWFEVMRGCGEDVGALVHDGGVIACAGDAAFAYVAAFRAHASVGFFQGAFLPDPDGLLVGDGKWMRHVKLRPGQAVNEPALRTLIAAAYADIRHRTGLLPD